ATPFVPYISALKDGVLLHRADKHKKREIRVVLSRIFHILFSKGKSIIIQYSRLNLIKSHSNDRKYLYCLYD
ncbi:hypothetical protein, partial [Haemophilus influenzae]|uniref:hypothetical protein n=1 Tax=Haemophilus influenzae TaxID=727 RepID=UPI00195516AB